MLTMSKNELRAYYEELFAPYPDVVTLSVFREMLGGISETFACKLLRTKVVRSFQIPVHRNKPYQIPKVYIMDYVVSDAYQNYKHRLKARI